MIIYDSNDDIGHLNSNHLPITLINFTPMKIMNCYEKVSVLRAKSTLTNFFNISSTMLASMIKELTRKFEQH